LRTLILGIGNTLLTDEGAGVHVVRYLAEHHAGEPDVTFLDGGTLSFTLAGDIADHEGLIVIDAARLDAVPGTVRCFEDAQMDRYLGRAQMSVHEVGLSDLMDMARLSDTLPRRRALIGIQPADLDLGSQPTAVVEAAVPEAARLALDLARQWRAEAALYK